MNLLKSFTIVAILCLGCTVYGQDHFSNSQIIAKIDSVAKTKNIEIGRVNILLVSRDVFDRIETKTEYLTRKSMFHFEGHFLVIENKYFNISKILYFYIKDNCIEFFFQGY